MIWLVGVKIFGLLLAFMWAALACHHWGNHNSLKESPDAEGFKADLFREHVLALLHMVLAFLTLALL